jgi:hypothetical protein
MILCSHSQSGQKTRNVPSVPVFKIKEVAREKGVDPKKLGDAVEEDKKGLDKGSPDLTTDEIRTIADQIKAGGYWSPK